MVVNVVVPHIIPQYSFLNYAIPVPSGQPAIRQHVISIVKINYLKYCIIRAFNNEQQFPHIGYNSPNLKNLIKFQPRQKTRGKAQKLYNLFHSSSVSKHYYSIAYISMSDIKNHRCKVPADGIKRVIIKNVRPSVQSGKYPAKGSIEEQVCFTANIFTDGHDKIFAQVLFRMEKSKSWHSTEMKLIENDRWEYCHIPAKAGIMEFKIQAWISEPDSWKDAIEKKIAAGMESKADEMKGIEIFEKALPLLGKQEQKEWKKLLHENKEGGIFPKHVNSELYAAIRSVAAKETITTSNTFTINIERKKARFSTWYELFPRSCSPEPGHHGTFRDLAKKIPDIADAGFDVIYLPPVHPIGKLKRKGKNNSLTATSEDPGSPWAIGSSEGGHKSLHPQLGGMDDFRHLVKEAEKHGLEIAMDIAFQCAPDHPYVKEHPEWFRWRADGTVQFAENPPKKYEDILPFDFESAHWESLWEELLSIFTFWIDKGISIFRVDNPHTKSLRMWEWLIGCIKKEYPDTIFLAEAFTRPNIMEHLAMTGFTQSYTYFTWRNTKQELQEYITDLTQTDRRYFFRPNFWPNTPDILPEHLVTGGENMHIIRLLLAATLSASYGIYGPVFERGINIPAKGKEEYTDNEKYEIKYWAHIKPTRIWQTIVKVNGIRKSQPALQFTNNIEFLNTSNEMIVAYLKYNPEGNSHLMIVISLDPHNRQSGWVNIPKKTFSRLYGETVMIYDILNEEQYTWKDDWNYVELDPYRKPAHIFTLQGEKAPTTSENNINHE